MKRSSQRTDRVQATMALAWQGLMQWTPRQIMAAVLGTVGFGLIVGIATVLIPNPFFGRDIPPVWWNYPIWILTAVLSGMLLATFVRPYPGQSAETTETRSGKLGLAGGFLAWFAVGCPVCNKIALLALGYAGAITWFTPIQPYLAAAAVILCSIALVIRLKGQVACPVPAQTAEQATNRETVGTSG